jgi:integrase
VALFKRGGVWWTYVWVRGVRHAKSTGTGNRKLAERIDNQYKEELNLRLFRMPEMNLDMPFEELFVRFLANTGSKPYHIGRAKLLLPFFGGIAIGRITKNLAGEYRLARHTQKQVSDATINRDLGCLRHFLYWAVDEGILPSNPLARPPLVRERRKRRPVMSMEEEALLLSSASIHLHRIIIAALDTGMRRGEILNQQWQDVDFGRRLLFVSHSKTAEGEAREIPFTDRMFNLLWKLRENEGPIFTFQGNPIHAVKTAWKATLRRAGIRHYRFHDLRHTFNTRLLEAGVMQEVRKALMGHSSGEDVHSMYTHVELPLKRDAIQKLQSWVAMQAQEPSPSAELPRSEEAVLRPQIPNQRR